MSSKNSLIAGEGYPFIVPLAIVAVILIYAGQFWPAFFFLILTVFVIWFFRNPERKVPLEDGLVVAPADGRILKIEDVQENAFLHAQCKKVSIFMNVFNVHVNRMPYSGRVEEIRYHKGQFLSADLDKASMLNEKNAVFIKTEGDVGILIIQIAGLIARRIVCWIKEGMCVQKGERFGMIRFGSRVELFLPGTARIAVKEGDRVKAGETPIGWLK
jgi:phosphatidylserine decarboxylase